MSTARWGRAAQLRSGWGGTMRPIWWMVVGGWRNLDLGWGWVAWHHVLRSLGMWHDGGVVWRIIVEQREGKRKGCEDK